MAKQPKPPSSSVRGRPQGRGGGQTTSQQKDGRAVSLEAGKALQRQLDTAPNAAKAVKAEGAGDTAASRVMEAAAKVELSIAAHPISPELVQLRVQELRRLISMTIPRQGGQYIEDGDEVELDVLGYIDGKLFLAQRETWFDIKPNPFLPGVFEQLINVAPPDNVVIQLRIPDNYPVEEHRGKNAALALTVRRAVKRVLPDADDPIFIALTARKAKNRKELEACLLEELMQERARLCVMEAKLSLMRELYLKVGINDDVPEELVDEEVRKRWKKQMGDAMAHQGISVEEQKEALQKFSTPMQRAESRRAVWEVRTLEALADAHDVTATESEMQKMIEDMTPGIRRGDIEQHWYQNQGLVKDMVKNLRLDRALLLLLGKAKVTFHANPRPADKPFFTPLPTATTPPPASGSTSGSGSKGEMTATRGLKRPPSKAGQ